MGCGQSDTTGIHSPVGGGFKKSKISSKEQVNDMPNDQQSLAYFDHAKKLCQVLKLSQAEQIADEFFQCGFIDEAIDIYQRIIAANPSYKSDFEGLGNSQLPTSYYEWFVFKWYDENRKSGKIKSSPYDALSICYGLIGSLPKYRDDMKKGQIWYTSMAKKYPQSHAFMMGWGNLFYELGSFDQALKCYDKVTEMKPDFPNAYLCKALIYQYKRINLPKADQNAKKVIQLTKSNCYAELILGKNVKDIDEKIAKLKQSSANHPYYPRLTNQIGICYGGTKKLYDQAIAWYMKCIQIAPQYYSSYNNIGVNNELKKDYAQAKKWYYKAILIKPSYVSPHDNLRDVYTELSMTDLDIQNQVNAQPAINKEFFFWKIGLAYYNSKTQQNCKKSVQWIQKALKINPENHQAWNSYGISLDQIGNKKQAIEAYLKVVSINPQYSSAYYNAAISYKALNMMDQCQKMYKMSVQTNPKYSYAWNNLGNIYKNKDQYEQAAEYYQNAIEFNSTYTLALANLGICYLKFSKYKQAFAVFQRAKQCLPNDNNSLSSGNKAFLKQQIDKFDKQGSKWKKTGSITDQQKQSLKKLIEEFQNKFKSITSAAKYKASTQKMFNPQILQIIKIINEDKFELQKIEEIFELVQQIFHEDQEYFHIVPLLIIQKFTTDVFQKKKPIMQTEAQLKQLMKKIANNVSNKQNPNPPELVKNVEIKLTECRATNKSVNLFKDTGFFDDYISLNIEINRVNNQSKKSFTDFSLLVEEARKKSNGIPAGISNKIPVKQADQFKVLLRIMQKMFKKEITNERIQKIIKNIDSRLKGVQNVSLSVVVKQIMKGWNGQITSILKDRQRNNVETQFNVSDLLRAKCMYNSVDDIVKAVRVIDGHCKTMGYEIIELDNRLTKPQTQDVVFKIRIKNAVCQFQLAMKQDEVLYHLDHCVYQILRSPLGVIFGSYLFMSKDVKYPLPANCQDIADEILDTAQQSQKMVKMCAEYVLSMLNAVQK